ncbi:MAG: histidine kinase, partial [Bacteroidota bacterium]
MRHLLFWVTTLLLSASVRGLYYQDTAVAFYENMILLPPKIGAAYLLCYYQIPYLIFRRKYLQFFLSFLLSSYFFMILCRILAIHVVEEIFREGIFVQESLFEILTDYKVMLKVYFFRVHTIGLILAIFKLIVDHFEEKHQREILEKEKANAELNFLKAQLHPHFLFNTLNNLYLLTLQKSDKAPEMLIKLSDMLDYMLYQCNAPTVPVGKEVTLIENYIELEKLRYGDRLRLEFKKNIDDCQTPIAPLLLLSF